MKKEKKKTALAKAPSGNVVKAEVEAVALFVKELKSMFDYHGRRIDELVGVTREFGQEARGVLLEFAKFKQLHRVEAELQWLNGMHGRAVMETFKESTGFLQFQALMRERIKDLEAKQKQGTGLPEGLAYAPQYTWFCDKCGVELKQGVYATQEEAHAARDAHFEEKHPEKVEGPIIDAVPEMQA